MLNENNKKKKEKLEEKSSALYAGISMCILMPTYVGMSVSIFSFLAAI